MLGYVRIDKGELKVREYDTYTGYYCGICKSIGSRYGQLPRMVLSYDAAFMAIALSALSHNNDTINWEHCIAHYIQKKPVIRNSAIDYSADVMLILAWYKMSDDINDEGKLSARAGQLALRNVHKKLYAKYPDLCTAIEAKLSELTELENQKCPSLDVVSDTFGQMMRTIFEDGVSRLYGSDDNSTQIMGQMGYHLGKWIYLIDAIDDIDENIKTGSYNPLFYRFEFNKDLESSSQFKERIRENLKFNLFNYLAVISQCLDQLQANKYKGILENIIYFGLNHQTRIMIWGPDAKTTDNVLSDEHILHTND